MVEDALDNFPGTPLSTFEAFAADTEAMNGIKRVILSGGEVTLDEQLLGYVEVARRVPGVEHVRIQTNATRLHDRAFLRSLHDAGVDELFVSLHGHDSETCDAVTQRHGSFKAIMRGIEAIAASPVAWLSNTCIVSRNVAHLQSIVTLASDHGAQGCELWNVWPRVDDAELREEIVAVTRVRPHLLNALKVCRDRRMPAVVKWFPRCLLGEFAHHHDDSQPTALIDEQYWQRLPQYACLYAGVCANGAQCSGLSHAYIEQHGWEVDTLEPQRDLSATPAADRRGAMHVRQRADPVQVPVVTQDDTTEGLASSQFGLRVGLQLQRWQLREVQPTSKGLRLGFDHETTTTAAIWLRVSAVEPDQKALFEVDAAAISYEKSADDPSEAVALARLLAEHMANR